MSIDWAAVAVVMSACVQGVGLYAVALKQNRTEVDNEEGQARQAFLNSVLERTKELQTDVNNLKDSEKRCVDENHNLRLAVVESKGLIGNLTARVGFLEGVLTLKGINPKHHVLPDGVQDGGR